MYDLDRKMPVDDERIVLLENRVAITNRLCFVHLILSIIGILYFLFKGYPSFALVMGVFMAGYALIPYLGRMRFYTFSKIWIILLSNISIYFCALKLGPGSGIQYAFIVLFSLPFLLFNPKQKWFIIVGIVFSIVVFFSFYFKVFDEAAALTISEQKGLFPSSIFFIFIMFGSYCFFAMNISNDGENGLKQYVSKLEQEVKNSKFEKELNTNASIQQAKPGDNVGKPEFSKKTEMAKKAESENKLVAAKKIEDIKVADKNEAESATDSKMFNEQMLAYTEQELIDPILRIASAADNLYENKLDKSQSEAVKIIRDKAYDIKTVLNDFSLYAKIKENGTNINLTEFSIQETLMNLVQRCNGPEMQKKGVVIEAQFNPELPVLVKGDKDKFEQVVTRLVVDAVKRTEEGKIIVYVLLESPNGNEDNQFIIFSVEDPGLYLPDSKREQMNLSFQRKGGGKDIETHDELGLGLSIVKYLVDIQGGVVFAENEGVKNRISVKLPYEVIARRITDTLGSDGKSSNILKFSSRLHFLVAEDNPVNQKMFNSLLTKWGGLVTTVSNGEDAIKQLKKETNFDIIIMDIHMDKMDGIDCTRIIRNEMPSPTRSVPIIAVSSEIGFDKREYYRQLGMNDFLSKPFTSTNLFNVIVSNLPTKSSISTSNNYMANKNYWAIYKNAGEPKHYVNLKNLQDLAEGDNSFIDEILGSIFESVPQDFARLKSNIEGENWDGVRQLSHKIRSSVILIGSKELEDKIYALQEASENAELYSSIPYLYNQVVSLARLALKEINRFFNDDSIELIKGKALQEPPLIPVKKLSEIPKPVPVNPSVQATDAVGPKKKFVSPKVKEGETKLLLVEDNMAVMKILSNKLEKDGYKIDYAHDGKQALDKLDNNTYDLVLTDLMLPFVNGLEIVNYIREKQKLTIPVIILTSVELEETVVEAFKIGVTDVLFKPFSPSELSARIKKYLQ